MEALGFHWPSLIAYLLNFTILLIVLTKFAYKPILKILDERSSNIKDSLELADKVREESAQQQAQLDDQLVEARKQGQSIIEDARSAAEKLSDQEREKSKKEAEEFLVKAKNDIERERDSAMDELRSNFGGLAVSAAEQIIQRSLDENTHKDIIDNVLENAFTDKTEES
ncbi:MAG: F0F1 ATP synthase subunit B [SAR202 cluster bacterium]|jgi:F-type H+-transporting ATPase subunit b|nr:ATP synthase F0 subunit B [Chloroflexota bacterium]MCH2523003.1 F0F1 ATP synthase subunit B [Dehalococcoidia bacterium]MQG24680.1 F0F1 ATP synthase subunit B [SAR202 cluster bacterium]MQG84375.1 F0F1 ATP synthase subunit B [SAR202 cluster bacterium]|tara:strand:- start:1518 stop:2024 length:507 start_codon:yes stop_codon:yes gene_type:complete